VEDTNGMLGRKEKEHREEEEKERKGYASEEVERLRKNEDG
jgi:hypothetical protein